MGKKKTLLVGGCSFTDKNFYSVAYPDYDANFPKWPELVGEEFDWNVINTARSGDSIEMITNKIISELWQKKDSISVVMVGLTEAVRYSLYDLHSVVPIHIFQNHYGYPEENGNRKRFDLLDREIPMVGMAKYIFENMMRKDDGNPWRNMYKPALRRYYTCVCNIIMLCEALNIKYIIGANLQPIETYTVQVAMQSSDFSDEMKELVTYENLERAIGKEVIKIMDHLNANQKFPIRNCIGYPFVKSLGGRHTTDFMSGNFDYQVGRWDAHPNQKGHELIAKQFIDKYKERYS